MKIILDILLMGIIMLISAYVVPGVQVDGFGTAIIAAILIALTNATIGFILRVLTFPITVLTLGLFSFVITVLMILLVDSMLDGFHTAGFWSAALLAIVIAIMKSIFGVLTKND
jgi:putative membrane protein